MITLKDYIYEHTNNTIDTILEDDEQDNTSDNEETGQEEGDSSNDDKENEKELTRRGNIKFTIWKEPKKKVNWINDNEKYQKIEYKYEDKESNIFIDFLLGLQENEWKLWVGKIGAVNYDDDPYCSFKTSSFKEAIISALDKVEEFIDDVEENPDNWVQFYK